MRGGTAATRRDPDETAAPERDSSGTAATRRDPEGTAAPERDSSETAASRRDPDETAAPERDPSGTAATPLIGVEIVDVVEVIDLDAATVSGQFHVLSSMSQETALALGEEATAQGHALVRELSEVECNPFTVPCTPTEDHLLAEAYQDALARGEDVLAAGLDVAQAHFSGVLEDEISEILTPLLDRVVGTSEGPQPMEVDPASPQPLSWAEQMEQARTEEERDPLVWCNMHGECSVDTILTYNVFRKNSKPSKAQTQHYRPVL